MFLLAGQHEYRCKKIAVCHGGIQKQKRWLMNGSVVHSIHRFFPCDIWNDEVDILQRDCDVLPDVGCQNHLNILGHDDGSHGHDSRVQFVQTKVEYATNNSYDEESGNYECKYAACRIYIYIYIYKYLYIIT